MHFINGIRSIESNKKNSQNVEKTVTKPHWTGRHGPYTGKKSTF